MRAEHGWQTWVRRGALAVADQGLMSGSNFILTILLARWLAPEQYGAYALALSVFFFVSAIHQALVLEPMSVLGTSHYADRRRLYAGALLWFHGLFSVVLAALLGGAAWLAFVIGSRSLAVGLAGIALAAPCILLFWLARMSCYVEFSPSRAAAGATLYSVVLLGGASVLSQRGWLSTLTAFGLMGGAALVVGVALLISLRPSLLCSRALLRDAATRHWTYGRWALGSSLVIWIPANIYYSITTAFLGIGSAGAFRALQNLTFPVTHTSSALSLLVQPQLSRTAAESGPAATIKPVMRIMGLYAAGALAWLAIVAFATDRVWQLLYHGNYRSASGLAVLTLAGVVFQVAAYAPAVGLRALQAPSLVFYAYSISAAACLLVGIPATRFWGLSGAVASSSAVLLLSFTATLILYRRKIRASEAALVPCQAALAVEAG